ncbi:hypothetical protein C0Q70_20091 [Pomacea canaliculata]|uniref:Uncharacterized protein n=1 Tax=Pomacea canaliculata TaxID=400727 RepID=A0A2T7NEK8_POMCA|nr:hypothetical protein C0Q70_20091 [Pomacea canaliculata]
MMTVYPADKPAKYWVVPSDEALVLGTLIRPLIYWDNYRRRSGDDNIHWFVDGGVEMPLLSKFNTKCANESPGAIRKEIAFDALSAACVSPKGHWEGSRSKRKRGWDIVVLASGASRIPNARGSIDVFMLMKKRKGVEERESRERKRGVKEGR